MKEKQRQEWLKKHEELHKKHLSRWLQKQQKKQPVPSEALEYVVNPVFKEV
jgi:hypothetical protein